MGGVNVGTDPFPIYRGDLFGREALLDPFPHADVIREMAPVVRLTNPDVLVLGRYDDVRTALQSPDILISGRGVGFNGFVNEQVPEPGILTSDGERHRKMRIPLMKYLSPAALGGIREILARMIDARIAELAGGGEVEAISEIAHLLPVEAISKLVGLPEEDRRKMLRWASASFNMMGPIEENGALIPTIAEDFESAVEMRDYILELDPDILRPGSWAAELFAQVRAGGMSIGDARASLRAFVLPSLDTTISATGNLLCALGCHPDQYESLRRNPALISNAVYESLRLAPPVRWVSRVAIEDYRAGDVFIPAEERVMLLFAAANRDPRKYPNPDQFDVTRRPADQLGWGTGPHICAGMHLARMEMEVLLESMVKRVARIEMGEPTHGTNRGLYAIESLPLRLIAA